MNRAPAGGGSGSARARELASGWRIWNREPCPAAGGSKLLSPPGLHKNGQLYVSPATRHAGGGVINCEIDTKKAALRPL